MAASTPGERAERALELRLAGASFDAIAKTLGYSNKGGAFKAVQRALSARKPSTSQRDAAEVELARLDAMTSGLWVKARKGDAAAVDRVLKIGERRMALLGLLAEESVSGTPAGVTALDEFQRRLAERQQRQHR